MHTQPTLNLTDVILKRAIFARLQRGPHTAVSLAAMIGTDLRLIEPVLARLAEEGRIVRDGVLYKFPLLAA